MTKKYKSASIILEIALGLMAVASLAVSGLYDTLSFALSIIGVLVVSYYGTKFILPRSRLYQYVGSSALAILTALLIYQMHGMIEIHFLFFIGAILLIDFKKWELQIPITLITVVHHVILAYIQYAGNKEVYFTSDNYMDLQTFIVHVGLAAVIFLLCGYWSYIFKKTSEDAERKNQQMQIHIQTISKTIEIAKQIANGNLNVAFEAEKSDELASALHLMQQNLLASQKREQEEKYYTIGLADSGEIMRNNNTDIKQLSDNILKYLVKYLGANQAMMFVANHQDQAKTYLELTACYAYDNKKYLDKKIEVGQGLTGRAFQEKEVIYITDLPKGYVNISSGLGYAPPDCILIVPLIINKEAFGVIEFAFFSKIENYQIEFVKKAGENLASTLSALKINEQTKELLHLARQDGSQSVYQFS